MTIANYPIYEGRGNEELLSEYLETREQALRHELVLRYSYIVKMIAMQMRGVYVSFAEIGDIVNECIITLMNALDKFDPSKNVKFESYLSLRIRGTIIDMARKQDWVPRSFRKTAKLIDNAEWELYNKLGRHATDQEMADHLGMDQDKYLKLLGETNLHNMLSLDALMDGADDQLATLQPVNVDRDNQPETVLQNNEMIRVMQEAIGTLRENEQLTISLYYRKNLNMREIAGVLNVKEPRVSQIHANALRKLRIAMKQYLEQ